MNLPQRARRPFFGITSLAFVAASVAGGAPAARADHWDNTPTSGRFEPQFDAAPTNNVAGASSALTFRVAQADHETVIRTYQVNIAPGWRFAAASIRPANLDSCRAGTSSNDFLGKAEGAGFVRFNLATNGTRDNTPQVNTTTRSVETESPGPAKYAGGLWFLRWDNATSEATLCGFATTSNSRVPSSRNKILFQMSLRMLADSSWRLRWDFAAVPGSPPGDRSIVDNAGFQQDQVSVLGTTITLYAMTGGNFNRDSAGEQATVAFSGTPTTPGYYPVHATLTPCAVDDSSGCKSAAVPAERDVVMAITPPPTSHYYSPGLLTGPRTNAFPWGIGLVRGSQALALTWDQPSDILENPVDHIKGYVILIAEPGDQATKHFEYVVTNPGLPDFDAREPCGNDGTMSRCSLTLEFPLMSSEGRLLSGNGIYNIVLVTVYEDGHRTDGRCDDATGDGVRCPADEAGFNISEPGVSTWQVIMRTDPWPNAFIMRRGRGGFLVYLLFVDFMNHSAEYYVLNRNGGLGTSYVGHTPTIQGSGDTGVVSFASTQLVSSAQSFRFDGVILPTLARGLFTLYDPKNPSLERGLSDKAPTASTDLYEGARI